VSTAPPPGSDRRQAVAQAQADVALARQRLHDTLAIVQARLEPRNLAREAAEAATETARHGAEAARANPRVTAGVAAGALGLALVAWRRPLARLFRRGRDATASAPAGSTADHDQSSEGPMP
jgi:cytosine/adenosine deaminase-related metal-dependent hydrolase